MVVSGIKCFYEWVTDWGGKGKGEIASCKDLGTIGTLHTEVTLSLEVKMYYHHRGM